MADKPTLNADEVWHQLLVLRGQTLATGLLFEPQILQLKMWPQLAAPHADEITFTFEAARRKGRKVTYQARSEADPPANFVSDLLPGLDRSIKQMLGGDWTVEFYDNGELVFSSPGGPPETTIPKAWEVGRDGT